ncbi:hypothetical protein [Arthrobacter sp. PsM3]|uniref:hypothetical protein n=1 Tax=Arthrobacter sp. PsM3 TaxID=3030531 RepID=UPI00263A9701|nr:hypothetical protein [Arthrobacter sp. PsM3]MDN4645542.1 hypothetical protein [Arthrobacter sp. PsM3]
MEAKQDGTAQSEHSGEWSRVDELNWAADRSTIRVIKKRGEEPSDWLATEYRELSARRKAACQVTPRG